MRRKEYKNPYVIIKLHIAHSNFIVHAYARLEGLNAKVKGAFRAPRTS